MENQIIELLHIINNKIDKIDNGNRVLTNKVDNVIERINDLEKDINNKTSLNSSSNEYLTVNQIVEIYKISKEKIYKDIKSNSFNEKYSQKKNGGKILIKKRDWDSWFLEYIIPGRLNKCSTLTENEEMKKRRKKKKKNKKTKKKNKKTKKMKELSLNKDIVKLTFD